MHFSSVNHFHCLLSLQQKPNDGPPDLDEMWRDFKRRLAGLFGRGKKSASPEGGKPSPGGRRGKGIYLRIAAGIVLGALVAAWVGSGVFIVRDGYQGVILRLGQYWQTVGPGVHWNLPWPFGTHRVIDAGQNHTIDINSGKANAAASNATSGSVITRDGEVFNVQMTVQYQVKRPTDYFLHNAAPVAVLEQAAQAALRSVAGTHTGADLLAAQGQASGQAALRQQIVQAIQRALDVNQTGLNVTAVTLARVQLPAAAAADTPASAATVNANAPTDAQALADAQAYRDRVIAQAQADAERFTLMEAQYRKSPDAVRERIYAQTMQQIYANTTKVFIDSQASKVELSPGAIVDAMRQRAGGAAGAPSGASGASAAAPDAAGANAGSTDNVALRSRDALRSRTRETDQP